jgi:hypothetical protein
MISMNQTALNDEPLDMTFSQFIVISTANTLLEDTERISENLMVSNAIGGDDTNIWPGT